MTPIKTLSDALARAGRHPRALTWQIRYRFGFARSSPYRTFQLVAPASAAHLVLYRLHNGILLLNPAAVHVTIELSEHRLEPLLGALREIHQIPITVDEQTPLLPVGTGQAIPAVNDPGPAFVEGRIAAGLDIGGTGMKACALRDGRVRTAQAETWPAGEQGVESLIERARALISEVCGGEPEGSLGVGFASPMGVDGRIVGLSTVMRQKLGDLSALEDFPQRVAAGLVDGPVAIYNDLAILGRDLSAQGRRRLLRLQVGTSFGGCWIDADGTVNPGELGRLVVDASAEARPHTYLPIRGAMKAYLSNFGIAQTASALAERLVTPQEVGFVWRDWFRAGDVRARTLLDWVATLMVGVAQEGRAILPGLAEIEVGGGMLRPPSGRHLQSEVRDRLKDRDGFPDFSIASDPGFDSALAAARAPLAGGPLRGLRVKR